MTLLNDLKTKETLFFNVQHLKPEFNIKYKKLTPECIYSLIFIIYFLEERGLTLTHICLHDFEIFEQCLYLKTDVHVVELINDYYHVKTGITYGDLDFFSPSTNLPPSTNNHKFYLYKSVGQFMFWILTHTNIDINKESVLDTYYGTKPYYFIKNTMEQDPSLIYL